MVRLDFDIIKVDLENEKVKDFMKQREMELNGRIGIDETPLVYTQVGLENKDKTNPFDSIKTDEDYIFHQDIEDEENLIKQLEDDKFLDYAETQVVINLIRNKINKVKKVLKKYGDNAEIRKQNRMEKKE